MHERRVGQLYEAGKQKWPQGAEYLYTRQGHELRLFMWRATQHEIEAVTVGRVELALVQEDSLLLLLYRFAPGVPWGGAPYIWWDVVADEQPTVLPALRPDSRALLQVHVVDAATGILRAVRTITLSPIFTSTLELELRTRLVKSLEDTSAHEEDYRTTLTALHRKYPHPEMMLANAIATYQSGE